MAVSQTRKKKKKFHPNLSFFIFFLILMYIVILAWGYLSQDHVSIYEVNAAKLDDDTPLYGYIMRSEEVVNSEADGYINYYNAEGNRVGVGDVIYTLDTSGDVNSILKELQNNKTSTQNISAMRETIASFQNSFKLSNYSAVKDLSFNINNVIFQENNKALYSDLNKAVQKAGKSKKFKGYTAAHSGVISYSVDGREAIKEKDLTIDLLDHYGNNERKQIQSNEKIKAGFPVYKLVTSNEWYLYVKIPDSYYDSLKSLKYVRVTIEKDNTSFNAAVELLEKDGCHVAKLRTNRFMERYLNDRYLKLEFSLNSANGLKIPVSSMLEKEYYVLPSELITTDKDKKSTITKQVLDQDTISEKKVSIGTYYIVDSKYYVDSSIVKGGDILKNPSTGQDYIVSSKENLYGVYCTNQGYCQFKPVDVLYKNKEYAIVSTDTQGGLSAYDHIIVDPSTIHENDFIN